MNIRQFRERHSYLIEQYQYVERELEGIYASVSGKSFNSGLRDVEKTNLNKLLMLIEEAEVTSGREILPESDKTDLRRLLPRRNFWVHNCYVDMLFDRKTDDIKNQSDIDQLENDIRTAETIRQRLFEIKAEMMK